MKDCLAQNGLLTSQTIQAHCTFLDEAALSEVSRRGTAIAHCPLSNAYFSAKPFRLREALRLGVKVGLGTDVAGGYSIDIMNAARQAVIVSRMREGSRILSSAKSIEEEGGKPSPDENAIGEPAVPENLAIDWKEALYLATAGGMKALGLPSGCGTFSIGAPFDAQLSESIFRGHSLKRFDVPFRAVRLYDKTSKSGVGALDFLDRHCAQKNEIDITPDALEKWFCLGDQRNRLGLWVQGSQLMTGM
jgi:guanine deaminase